MRFHILRAVFLVMGFMQAACAEVPAAVVAPSSEGEKAGSVGGVGPENGSATVSLAALVFEGSDDFGQACSLAIAAQPSSAQAAAGDDMEIYVRMDYTVHGIQPIDMGVDFYLYQRANQTYLPVESQEPGTLPVLAGAVLTDTTLPVDLNQLLNYENQGLLRQSMRIEFRGADLPTLMQSLQAVADDNTQLAANLPALNQMSRAVVRVGHLGHYDPGLCEEFSLVSELVPVTFQLGGQDKEEDHDHDHDHDAEHGDNHNHDHD